MEDFHHAQFKKDQRGQQIGLFGIFDGHGGPYAADFVRANLFVNLMQSGKFPADIYGAIKEAFETTDQQYLKQDAQANRDDGCTGVTAFIIGTKLYVANVGDSRAVLCRGGKAQPLSVDHKPNSKEERQRIENAGGVVVWAGTWRVGGVLAVSRAFGDKPLKRYVIATPDIREESLRDDDEFLILASDGLWDVISNQDAAGIVRNIHDPQRAAARLAEEAAAKRQQRQHQLHRHPLQAQRAPTCWQLQSVIKAMSPAPVQALRAFSPLSRKQPWHIGHSPGV
eukprot:CAMPEP_0202379020 /NCGR_PEP_ID=MMETSP1127-20130417/22137_1 /ASSEMBLY_ACC=CAM_ASM_000462 /TAXON_ID=3047 /ORGANISM="Dunaliella tertiolecta, Strain CCMP1320" /LENGTH=281 /DNA_ID=CAMNT_0048977445 /DNA_START=274 /DNA_END=1118 /DNA_ORIENTATION=-